jgi:adenylate kinase family enzyme
VVDLYKKFGKVKWIDAFGSVNEVYEETKKAMMPQMFFLVGPKCSGKTELGSALAKRTNMTLINFNKFIRDNGLVGKDDETVT